MYCFVRRDLSHPQQCVQSSHACIEAASKFKFGDLSEHPHLIMLGTKSEEQLENIKKKLCDQQIQFAQFNEADRNDELTAVCTDAVFGDKRDFFRKFQLLKDSHST